MKPISAKEKQGSQLAAALRDLHNLLQEHAPQWYTYAQNQKGELGLRRGDREQADAFLTLYNLLQEYAPVWYTKEHQKRAELVLRHLKNGQKRLLKGPKS